MAGTDVASRHDREVQAVAAAVRSNVSAGTTSHIQKGGVHHVVPIPGDKRFATKPVDTSRLTNIIEIDEEEKTVTLEPSVSFEELVRATLPLGLAPVVVPELRGITVGGAVSGCSVESMSYKFGGFHDSCLEYEIVTGAGEIRTLTRESDSQLFESLHGSYGTLGILTKIKARLIEAKPFVQMEYLHFDDYDEFRRSLDEHCRVDEDALAKADHDFVDGIVFGPKDLVLCVGRFSDGDGSVPSVYSGTDIYYHSAQTLSQDLMSAEEYFFRYDGECHWLTATVPPLQWKWVRKLFGKWLLGSTNLIGWSNRTAPIQRKIYRRPDVVVDVFIANTRLDEFWHWYRKDFDFWPLWVVPYRAPVRYPWISDDHAPDMEPGELIIDLAVYGKTNRKRGVDYSEVLEKKVYELGGIKTLIGRNHHTEGEFWSVYNKANYDAAKAELDPHGLFPNVFDKLGKVS